MATSKFEKITNDHSKTRINRKYYAKRFVNNDSSYEIIKKQQNCMKGGSSLIASARTTITFIPDLGILPSTECKEVDFDVWVGNPNLVEVGVGNDML